MFRVDAGDGKRKSDVLPVSFFVCYDSRLYFA